ncbi:CIC11C00000005241 [Sungouiella intermedia]|uniref:CIC11C00000002328 n=1 Tax=Sungouiella intermedia TaxID=45354 RepID=A0A1L0GIA4_9ASCO|nr:CIC11C00000002328 [[Candida] intermedia]SGZ55961.1 CIC11C00000005241 [[Candida] intermedia]
MDPNTSIENPAYTDHTLQQQPQQQQDTGLADSNDQQPKRSKKRKKKVEMACVYCRRSHMICDDSRPCLRCIKRGIGHLCHDEPTPGRQKKRPDGNGNENTVTPPPMTSGDHKNVNTATNTNGTPSVLQTGIQQSSRNGSNSMLTKALPFNQEPFFYSEHAGSEFSSLNDFLSMIDDPELVNGALNVGSANADALLPFTLGPDLSSNSNTNLNNLLAFSPPNTLMATFPVQQNIQVKLEQPMTTQEQAPFIDRNTEHISSAEFSKNNSATNLTDGNHQPIISDSARDKFFLTAADPTTEISPEERLKQVIKAKLEAGLLQPYNYAKGYARLQSYMDNYMNQSSRQRILKPLSIFRPAFRAIARTLKDVDLVLVEESFERMLLDYDRVFTSMAIPACLWRRTGEIYRGNKEFASLVGVTTDDLKDGKLAIYELMSEESAVNFWEKYGAIAFDKGQKAVLTSCNLRTKDGFKRKSCCFSFTIRRDRYNIPSCIVGNFIPIDP